MSFCIIYMTLLPRILILRSYHKSPSLILVPALLFYYFHSRHGISMQELLKLTNVLVSAVVRI